MSDPTPPSIPTPPPLPPRPRRPHWGLRILFAFILLVSITINLSMCSMSLASVGLRAEEEFPVISESLAWGHRRAPVKAAVLRLDGIIIRQAQGFFGSIPDPVSTLLTEIQAVTMDPTVNVILLEVNSPGGGVTASDEIYRALLRFKESDPDRRIVVSVVDMAASGGYYIALPADVIVAQPTSIVGSVGVMLSAVNMHELGEKIGLKDVSLTSGDNKALLSSLQPVDPAHTQILQELVDDMYHRFRDLVVEHRPFSSEYAEEHNLLDGRIFTARQAFQHGLVDEVGYGPEARAAVSRLFGGQDVAFYNEIGRAHV